MIRRLILQWRLDRALAKRKAQRPIYSAASRKGVATGIHKAFLRDPLIAAARVREDA